MKLTPSQLRRIIAEEVRTLRDAQQPESEFHWNNYMEHSSSMQKIAQALPGLHDSFVAAYEERASRGDVRSDALVDVILQSIAENL
jgi:hypothetical protein